MLLPAKDTLLHCTDLELQPLERNILSYGILQ